MLQDLRYALRQLTKRRGFTVLALVPLALGIGANTAIFSVLNGVLLRPLPYTQPDRLVVLSESSQKFPQMAIAVQNFRDWQEENRTFESMSAFRGEDMTLTGSGEPERVRARMASAGLFETLGATMVAGRDFRADEDHPGASPVALLDEAFWKRRFGGDHGVVGRTVLLNGRGYTVVGIAPSRLQLFGTYDVFLPLGIWDSVMAHDRNYHPGLYAVGRLKPGVSLAQAGSDLNGIARRLAEAYPKTNTGNGVALEPLKKAIVGDVQELVWILAAAVGFVLLIACANVANLLLARSTARQREIGIRMALGAARFRLLRQLLTESVLLAVVGGAAGLALAIWGTDAILKALPRTLPRLEEVAIDGRVLAFTLAATLLTGILFGLAPALQATHRRLHDAIQEGGRALVAGGSRLRNTLIVAEVALALVLLAGAGLMIRTMAKLGGVDPGFDPHQVMTMHVGLSAHSLENGEAARRALALLLERVRQIPGVEAAAFSTDLPLTGDDSELPFWVRGRPRPASEGEMLWALLYTPTPDYLKVTHIPLLRGRFFDAHDNAGSPSVAVIDEVLARSVFPGQNPVGQVVQIGVAQDFRLEIVGVVGHVTHWGLDTDATNKIRGQMYVPLQQIPDMFATATAAGSTLMIRSRNNPERLVEAVRAQVMGSQRDQPVYNVRSMEQIVSGSVAQRRFAMLLLGAFATLALLLASVGIYAVISYTVSQRTREIGIRMALGARQQNVLRLVVGGSMRVVLYGVAVGLAAALAVTRLMGSLLFGVSAWDPLTLAAVSALLVGVAALASYIPARRAARIDPTTALRYE